MVGREDAVEAALHRPSPEAIVSKGACRSFDAYAALRCRPCHKAFGQMDDGERDAACSGVHAIEAHLSLKLAAWPQRMIDVERLASDWSEKRQHMHEEEGVGSA